MKKFWILCLVLIHTQCVLAQSVGISANGIAPDNSAMLDVDVSALPANNKKGMLIPRVALSSNTDVSTIPSPANSLVVYNTNAAMTNGNGVGFYYWDAANGKWMYMATASNGPGTAGQVLTSTGAGNQPQWFPLIKELPSGNNDLKICVGKSNAWYNCNGSNGCNYNTGIIIDIDISGCAFTQVPYIFTSISGTSSHWTTTGATSIYNLTNTGFRVYVHGYLYSGSGLNVSVANSYNYYLMWMAIGK